MNLEQAARALRDADEVVRQTEADWQSANRELDAARQRYFDAQTKRGVAADALVNIASSKPQEEGRGAAS